MLKITNETLIIRRKRLEEGNIDMIGIIFDVDGTLWDSTKEVAVSWNRAIREHTSMERILTQDELKKEFGKPLDEIMDDLFPELDQSGKDELAFYMYQYENEHVKDAPCIVYDGVPETIRRLSGTYPLFIVSNCQSGYIEAFLENTGLGDCIQDFTCPGDTGKLKGDNIRIIMERNGIEEAVYVGDTQGDAQACRKAGIPMSYAAYGYGDVEGDYHTIHSFDKLLQIDYEDVLRGKP